MAITLVGTPQAGVASNGGSVTLTFDVAPQEGDVVYVGISQGDSGTADPTPSTAGYTLIDSDTTGTVWWGVNRKVMGATPDTDVVCKGTGAGTSSTAVVAIVLRGVDSTTPEDATPVTATDASGTTHPDPAAITTVTDGAWVIPFAHTSHAADADTAPTGYSNLTNALAVDTDRATATLSTKEVATAGVEDPGAYVWGSLPGSWWTSTVAVRPASAFSSTSLLATGDGTIVDVVNEADAASPLSPSVDDDPASPTDTDWVNNAVDVT